MKRFFAALAVGVASLAIATPAFAHVTVQPNEALAESFSAFVVRVPNERPNASTTRVEVRFPPLASVGFQDVPGWNREVQMRELDEPLEAFGEEVTEVVGSVTWSGGEIEPGEFAEFPFSISTPAGENELKFPALQTYDSGEVVRWTGPEDADEPAARLSTFELGEFQDEGLGELGVLHEVVDELEEPAEEPAPTETQAARAPEDDGDEDASDTGVILGSVGIGLGLIALIVSLLRGRG